MILIIHADMELWDFMLDGLKDREDVKDIPLNRYCNIYQRYIRNHFRNRILPYYFIFGRRLHKVLKVLQPGDKVIISAYTQRSLFNAIKQVVDEGVSIHLWMWNPISSNTNFENGIKLLKKDGFTLHTFDSKDAKNYGMIYHHTFYNMKVNVDINNISYDFYFLGAAKNREEVLNDLKNILRNYRCNFLIPSSRNDFITYKENLSNIQKTSCVVEIVQDKQYDITLRPLEALAYKKKLLTNNLHIKRYPFYNPNNIFIIGEDDFTNIESFINSPYIEIDNNIIKQFDINSWVDSF